MKREVKKNVSLLLCPLFAVGQKIRMRADYIPVGLEQSKLLEGMPLTRLPKNIVVYIKKKSN